MELALGDNERARFSRRSSCVPCPPPVRVRRPGLARRLGISLALLLLLVLGGPALLAFFAVRVLPRSVRPVFPASRVVVPRDGTGRYVVSGTVNGAAVEFLIDTGSSGVAIPPALAWRLDLRCGEPVQITTLSDVVPGYLVTLDEVRIGPLACTRVLAHVSERHVGDQVLLGMSFLGHYVLSQRGPSLTLRPGGRP